MVMIPIGRALKPAVCAVAAAREVRASGLAVDSQPRHILTFGAIDMRGNTRKTLHHGNGRF